MKCGEPRRPAGESSGYLPGELTLWPALSGARTLAFLEQLTGRPAVWRAELDRLQLGAADLARRVGTYSDGMKQKVGIVQALQCAPRLVLLDEPTKGLDPPPGPSTSSRAIWLARATTHFPLSHLRRRSTCGPRRRHVARRPSRQQVRPRRHLRGSLLRRAAWCSSADVDPAALSEWGRVVTATARRIELLVPTDRVASFVKGLGSLPVADLQIEAPSLEDAFLEA